MRIGKAQPGEAHPDSHRRCVDELLARGLLRSPDPARVLGEALAVIWSSARLTLGEVTLGAIFRRVFASAGRRFPEVVELHLAPHQERFRELATRPTPASGVALGPAVREILVELLALLGNLTAEVITPKIHEELAQLGGAPQPQTSEDDEKATS